MSLAEAASHSRPLPPNRHRPSLSTSGSASFQAALGSRVSVEKTASPSPHLEMEMEESGMTDDEVGLMSREELEVALRQAYAWRETVMSKVDSLESTIGDLERERGALTIRATGLQERGDDALAEQARLESDLEERNEMLDRLRARMAEVERQHRELQRRHAEQEKAFDAERQAFIAQETHLQTRLKTLTSQSSARETLPARASSSASTETDVAKEELASLRVAHAAVLAQLHTLVSEVQEVRRENGKLVEENEGWEFLVRERTLNGQLGDLFGSPSAPDEPPSPTTATRMEAELSPGVKTETLDKLEEDVDSEMEDLHSDLEAQSPIFDDDHAFARNLDEGRRKPRTKHGRLAPPQAVLNKRPKGENLGDLPVTGSGLDLAAELGRAEAAQGGEMRPLGKGDEGEALRAEVKNLREANKALTLYCSKIIDRIIAQEGFEHVLSVDYRTRRMGKGGSSMSRRPTARVAELFVLPPPAPAESTPQPAQIALGSIAPTSAASRKPPAVAEPSKDDAKSEKSEKRAKRGFSLDLRSFGFGSSAEKEKEKQQAALKPLALVGRSEPITQHAPASHSSVPPLATRHSGVGVPLTSPPASQRKLAPQEEDDEDRRERHRMEAALKLMGIDKVAASTSALATSPVEVEEPATASGGWLSRLSLRSPRPSSSVSSGPSEPSARPASSASAPGSRGTPLSRLSSALGTYEPLSPTFETSTDGPVNISPERAAAALKAFDEREAQQAKAISKGRAESAYTSPGPIRRQSQRRSASSTSIHESPGRTGTVGKGVPRVGKNESISTLWSMGGSSRPSSVEIEPVKEEPVRE